jgi:hypothetical protein
VYIGLRQNEHGWSKRIDDYKNMMGWNQGITGRQASKSFKREDEINRIVWPAKINGGMFYPTLYSRRFHDGCTRHIDEMNNFTYLISRLV